MITWFNQTMFSYHKRSDNIDGYEFREGQWKVPAQRLAAGDFTILFNKTNLVLENAGIQLVLWSLHLLATALTSTWRMQCYQLEEEHPKTSSWNVRFNLFSYWKSDSTENNLMSSDIMLRNSGLNLSNNKWYENNLDWFQWLGTWK